MRIEGIILILHRIQNGAIEAIEMKKKNMV